MIDRSAFKLPSESSQEMASGAQQLGSDGRASTDVRQEDVLQSNVRLDSVSVSGK